MDIDYIELYERAQKRAIKDNKLLNLEEMSSNTKIIKEVGLGRKDILLKKIVGTKTASRGQAFSINYMPLLSVNSEFADKWRKICKIHLEEGIRDPVKVYEYLNWYYVQEGNKRVSVLKFFDAYSIQADVIRIIPEYDADNPEICLYYSFMKFYDKTHVDYIWMSNKENFDRLYVYIVKYNWIGKRIDDTKFRNMYYRFRKYFYEEKGDILKITTGDAFLKYLDIFQYEEENPDYIIKENVSKLMSEFEYLENPKQRMIFDDISLDKRSLISSLVNRKSIDSKIKIAFIYGSNPTDSSWTDWHDQGRKVLETTYGDQVETKVFYDIFSQGSKKIDISQQVVNYEADLVFVTTPIIENMAVRAATEYKKKNIFLCTQHNESKLVHSYFGRMFEVEFLAGIIAGALSKTNNLGYILGEPIAATIVSINAFTLGARFVNPYAKVYVGWIRNLNETMVDEMKDQMHKFDEYQVDIVSLPPTEYIKNDSFSRGIYCLKSQELLAEPVWNWGEFYLKLVDAFFSGTLKSYIHGSGSSFFWWGLDSNIIDIKYGKSLPDELKETVGFMKKMVGSGTYSLFAGPLEDNLGNIRLEREELISVEDILTMNWLVKGVEGKIPVIHIYEENSMLSKQQGVYKSYER